MHFIKISSLQIFVQGKNASYQCVRHVYLFIVINIENKEHMANFQGNFNFYIRLQELIENISELLLKTNKSLEDLSE